MRKRYYYLEAKDDHSNEVLAKSLASDGTELKTVKHETVRVYEVTEKQLAFYLSSKSSALRVTLWTCLDGDKLAMMPLDFAKRKKIAKVRRLIASQRVK